MVRTRAPGTREEHNITSDFRMELEAMGFPANRDELVEEARARRYNDELIDWLAHLPDERYQSVSELVSGVSREDIEHADEPRHRM